MTKFSQLTQAPAVDQDDYLTGIVDGDNRNVTFEVITAFMAGQFDMLGTPVLPPSNDCDLITQHGIYRTNSSTLNSPGSNRLLLHMQGVDRAFQFAGSAAATSLLDVKFRELSGAGWSAWQTFWHGANLVLTTSATDNTAGRLLKVGDFGLGATAPSTIADLDSTSTPSGLYQIKSDPDTIGARPSGFGSSVWGYCRIDRHDATRLTQIVWTVNRLGANAAPRWTRKYLDGAWGAWVTEYNTGNILGTVSQSGGAPTGAVLQGNASAAAPAGGYSQRTAAGFQRVHHVVTTSASADTTLTFTNAFLSGSTPAVTITPVGAGLRPRIESVSATALVFSIRNDAGDRVAAPAHINVAGRWSNMT